MTFILESPAIIRVLAIFLVIMVAIRMKVALGNSFLLGSVLMGLLFGMDLQSMVSVMLRSVFDPKTLSLAVIVSLILVLSSSLERSGQMRRLLSNFKGLVQHQKINLIIFPALIGLLPMPGGAVFSAPMVKDLGKGQALSPSKLSYVNYWFRHIWEYCWPLYPGILLVTVLADISITSFMFYSIPVTLVALLLGYLPILNLPGEPEKEAGELTKKPIVPFLTELTPILIVIIPGLMLGMVLSRLAPSLSISRELGLHISLLAGIFWVWFSNRFTTREVGRLLFSFDILNMIYMVVTILLFKGILEHSHAAQEISMELIDLRIPLLVIIMFLPFLIGLISGYTLAYVGVALPILIPLIQTYGEMAFIFPYTMLIMVSGFAGVLLSPLHLCFILSNQYFGADLKEVYRHLWYPTGGILLFGVCYFLAGYWFLL